MTKRTVTIRSASRRTKNLTYLDGKFRDDNNNTWYLMPSGKIKTDDPDAPSDRQMKENDYGKEYRLLLTGQQDQVVWSKDDKKEAGYIEFYKKHPTGRNIVSEKDVLAINPDAELDGESILPDVQSAPKEFEIVDHELESMIGYYQADIEWQVMGAIRDMGWPEIYNNAFRMGIDNPHTKDARAVFNEVRNQAMTNGVEFLRSLRESSEVEVIVSKAIGYGIIEWDGVNYKFGNQVVGANEEQVALNFKNDEGMYEKSVKPEVIQKDKALYGTARAEDSFRLQGEKKEEPKAEKEPEPEMAETEESKEEETPKEPETKPSSGGKKGKGRRSQK